MYLERLSVSGANITDNPNEYFKPLGKFNTASAKSDVQMPNCTTYAMLESNEMCDATERMKGIAIKDSIGYHNAKYWYQETGLPKGKELREGAVAVFDGNFGHVAIVASKIDATHATITHSQYDPNKSLRNYKYWQRIDNQELVVGKSTMQGVGKLIGYIYLPIDDIRVPRDKSKNQINVTERMINVRKDPSLSAEAYNGRYCPRGIYNVINSTKNDGYTWYKLESKHWIAGVEGVTYYEAEDGTQWVEPEPVAPDIYKNQICVDIAADIREAASMEAEVLGRCKQSSYYDVLDTEDKDNRWFKIGERAYVIDQSGIEFKEAKKVDEWVRPQPMQRDENLDQIYIDNNVGTVNIRKEPSTSAEIVGYCVNKVYYEVLGLKKNSDFTWYCIGENSYVAGISEVKYFEANEWVAPRPAKENKEVNQVFINNTKGSVRIRKTPSLGGEVMGYVENLVYYNVLDTVKGDMNWYHLGENSYIAGIHEVEYIPAEDQDEWVAPTPVSRDAKKNQIQVSKDAINIRREPTTKSDAMGTVKNNSYYDVLEVVEGSSYTWYKIGNEAYVAGVSGIEYLEVYDGPVPTKDDPTKDQLYVGNVALNIRKEPSTSAKKVGVCEQDSTYNVLGTTSKGGYTWYKLAENAWVAGIEEVIYYPKGSSRKAPALKKEIPQLKSSLDIALTCVNRNEGIELYDELYSKVHELNEFINENFDSFEYDIVDPKEYDEIDLLYTTDIHGAWVGYDEDGNYLSPVFNYDDVSNYRTKLGKNNVKALLVDCGDWSRPCRVYDEYKNTGKMVSADQMNAKEYFASTFGNHEWRWETQDGMSTEDILKKSKSMTACNLFKNGKLLYKPYRTAKIGSKRIGVIGIGYPSPNGAGSYSNGVWTYGNYTFLDGDKLFAEVQKHIDTLKANNFDYIVVVSHMCKSTYESDSRYNARTDSLIRNTKGLTAVLQGHYNFATNAETINDKGNSPVLLAHEASANMNSFGRLQLKPNRVSSYLLDERTDLNVI